MLGGLWMFGIGIIEMPKLPVTWADIYYGLQRELLDCEDVSMYAEKCIEEGNDNFLVLELAWKPEDRQEMLEEVKELVKEDELRKSKTKWLYYLLTQVMEEDLTFDEWSSEINRIYALFDYPKEMDKCVPYMPSADGYNPSKHTARENQIRLKENTMSYINELRREIVFKKEEDI